MERKVTVTRQTKIDLYYNVDELEQMILEQCGLKDATLIWDEYSCGGIRGASIVHSHIEEQQP